MKNHDQSQQTKILQNIYFEVFMQNMVKTIVLNRQLNQNKINGFTWKKWKMKTKKEDR